MRTLFALVVLAVPSSALDRGRPSGGAMAARRAETRPSVMAARRGVTSYVAGARSVSPAPAYAAAGAPATPPAAPVVPMAVPADPELGPRLTPPRGTPVPAHNRRQTMGYKAEAAAEPRREGLPPFITNERQDEKGPAGVKVEAPPTAPAVKVTELRVGSANRQFGGASDPVVFLTGGVGN